MGKALVQFNTVELLKQGYDLQNELTKPVLVTELTRVTSSTFAIGNSDEIGIKINSSDDFEYLFTKDEFEILMEK